MLKENQHKSSFSFTFYKIKYSEGKKRKEVGVVLLVLRHEIASQQQLETSYILNCNIVEEAN